MLHHPMHKNREKTIYIYKLEKHLGISMTIIQYICAESFSIIKTIKKRSKFEMGKITGLVSQTIYFNARTNYMVSPLKQSPLESNADFHPLPSFYSLLKGFFCDAPQLPCYDPLDGLHAAFKAGLLDDPLELEEKTKSYIKQDQVNREVVGVR